MSVTRRPILWTSGELARFLRAAPPPGALGSVVISGVTTNVAETVWGDLYVPLDETPGISRKTRVRRALAAGAAAVLVAPRIPVPSTVPAIWVENMAVAMEAMARFARWRFTGRMVGVTGSVGKTTTKDLVAHLLAHVGVTHSTRGSLNNPNSNLGTVAGLPANADFAVLELAMRSPYSLAKRAAVARPHVGILTGIGVSHGALHKAPDSIFETKMSLFDHVEMGGAAVFPSWSPRFPDMVTRIKESKNVRRVIRCGREKEDDVRLVEEKIHAAYSRVRVEVEGRRHTYLIGQPGFHFVQNSLLAIGSLLALDVPLEVLGSLASFAPTERRTERFRVVLRDGPMELIDDAYNAAPDSVLALLSILRQRSSVLRRVLVLGDMLELGDDERDKHLSLVPNIAEVADVVVAVGPNMKLVADALHDPTKVLAFPSSAEAAKEIGNLVRPGDLVAVKGSFGMKMIRIINAIRRNPSERRGMHWSIEMETGGRNAEVESALT